MGKPIRGKLEEAWGLLQAIPAVAVPLGRDHPSQKIDTHPLESGFESLFSVEGVEDGIDVASHSTEHGVKGCCLVGNSDIDQVTAC